MWFNLTLLLFALAGLVVLFSLKALEVAGRKTPLERFRARTDAFITSDLSFYRKTAYAQCVSLCRRGYFLCRERLFSIGSTLLASLHHLTLRLGEYLRARKALPTQGTQVKGSVSFYLKNVLEYKRNAEEMQKKNTGNSPTQTNDTVSDVSVK